VRGEDIPRRQQCSAAEIRIPRPPVLLRGKTLAYNADDDIASAVREGVVPSHSLEAELGDCGRSASVRRQAVELTTGRSLEGLPLTGIIMLPYLDNAVRWWWGMFRFLLEWLGLSCLIDLSSLCQWLAQKDVL
jgi:hypothetical protein